MQNDKSGLLTTEEINRIKAEGIREAIEACAILEQIVSYDRFTIVYDRICRSEKLIDYANKLEGK